MGTYRSFLWGAGGWNPDCNDITKLETIDLSYCRSILRTRWKRDTESYVDYMRRSAKVVKRWKKISSIRPMPEQIAISIHRWAGHVARQDSQQSPIAVILRWRDIKWWRRRQDDQGQLDPHNKERWKHNRKGPIVRWENALCKLVGEDCKDKAQYRKSWKAGEKDFVQAYTANTSALIRPLEELLHSKCSTLRG